MQITVNRHHLTSRKNNQSFSYTGYSALSLDVVHALCDHC